MPSDQYLDCLQKFLASSLPKSLFVAHPNDVAKPSFMLPPEWETWWDWAASTPEPWVELLSYYVGQRPCSNIPSSLSQLIDNVKVLQLTRSQGLPPVPAGDGSQSHEIQYANTDTGRQAPRQGMSPKKQHEVSAMTAHITQALKTSSALKGAHHVVDIGAGQGYLSWNLRALGMHVLALDSSAIQANGAERRRSYGKRSGGQGSLTYKIAKVTPNSLLQSVDEWITALSPTAELHPPSVVFVALHACGSLTADILRTSVSAMRGSNGEKHGWTLKAAFVVGCCYNMMEEKDFTLYSDVARGDCPLSPSHLQLAAQVPSTWLDHKAQAAFALRKVSWRALLEVATTESDSTNGCLAEKRRLGRVNNALYQRWDQFLRMSLEKMHKIPIPGMELFPEKLVRLEKQLSTLHTLRCLLGPCVESFIIWDRYTWLKEVSECGTYFEVHLLNLFDQSQASGRNILIDIISN